MLDVTHATDPVMLWPLLLGIKPVAGRIVQSVRVFPFDEGAMFRAISTS
jgi:hypothetical protein